MKLVRVIKMKEAYSNAYLFIFNDDCTMWSAGFYLACYLVCCGYYGT
jgi:hypothetical protein